MGSTVLRTSWLWNTPPALLRHGPYVGPKRARTSQKLSMFLTESAREALSTQLLVLVSAQTAARGCPHHQPCCSPLTFSWGIPSHGYPLLCHYEHLLLNATKGELAETESSVIGIHSCSGFRHNPRALHKPWSPHWTRGICDPSKGPPACASYETRCLSSSRRFLQPSPHLGGGHALHMRSAAVQRRHLLLHRLRARANGLGRSAALPRGAPQKQSCPSQDHASSHVSCWTKAHSRYPSMISTLISSSLRLLCVEGIQDPRATALSKREHRRNFNK